MVQDTYAGFGSLLQLQPLPTLVLPSMVGQTDGWCGCGGQRSQPLAVPVPHGAVERPALQSAPRPAHLHPSMSREDWGYGGMALDAHAMGAHRGATMSTECTFGHIPQICIITIQSTFKMLQFRPHGPVDRVIFPGRAAILNSTCTGGGITISGAFWKRSKLGFG